ncbi:MAG TPA: hemerythrin domain-containing protein [Blastocatellia bacterium]|nr:hemerythrin domain-containing protein [Blastocatellia bacterium]
MDIFALLKQDHEKVAGIFEQLEPTTERAEKTREELFARLKAELDLHALLEETILYPALKQEGETREIALEGVEEHRVVKQLLKELEAMPVTSEQWTAKLTVLKENVEHHVEEEEGEMFKKARATLTREHIDRLTALLESEKKAQKATAR